jgi:hypothetical protein
MAKFKPAGSRKASNARSNAAAIPCGILILTGSAIIAYLFYQALKSAN